MKKVILGATVLALSLLPGLAGADTIPPFSITSPSSSTSPMYVDQLFNTTVVVYGGLAPYTFSIISGSLPTGLSLDSNTGEISGTPTVIGSYTFTLQANDSNGASDSITPTFVVAPQTPDFSYSRTPTGYTLVSPITVRIQGIMNLNFCSGANYYQLFTSGNTGSYSYSGTYYHTPGEVVDDTIVWNLPIGVYNNGVRIICGNQNAVYIGPGFEVVSPDLAVSFSASTGPIYVNQPFDAIVQVSNGVPPYTLSITSGSLPQGITFDSNTNEFLGTPTQVGTYPFTLEVVDSINNTKSVNSVFIISPQIPFSYSRTPDEYTIPNPVTIRIQGVMNLSLCGNGGSSYQLFTSGNTGSYSYSGTYYHTPGEVVDDTIVWNLPIGVYNNGVRIICGTQNAVLIGSGFEIVPPDATITSLGSSAVPMYVNQPYNTNVTVYGGLAPYAFDITSGSLPPGISLNFNTGEISGTPTVTGSYPFTLQVVDSNGSSDSISPTFIVSPQIPFSYLRTLDGYTIPNPVTIRIQGIMNLSICENGGSSYQLFTSGNTGSFAYAGPYTHTPGEVVDDTIVWNLPIGVYNNGVRIICGTQNAVLIGPGFEIPPVLILTSQLNDGTVGVVYSQNINISGGASPWTWSTINGSLPNGLALTSSSGVGIISGTPTTIGVYNFTVHVTDINNNTAIKDLSITIHGNTPAGTDVLVGPLNGVTLTFDEVTTEGQTTVATSGAGAPPPTGFKLGNPPTYYSIDTTATFVGDVEVCISWTQGQFNNENNLKLWHYDGTNWTDVTTSLDTVNNIICGVTTSFSDFAIFEKKQVAVQIDIKPGSDPNSINLGSNGVVPVAIFSTSEFDATTIDPLSISLASAPVKLKGNGTPQYSFQDINNDGLMDLVAQVSTDALQLSSTDQVANLVGYTYDPDHTEVVGSDTVRVIQ